MCHALINNSIIPMSEATVGIEDRGYQFGDGVYEVVGVYNGKCFKIDEHLTRLQRSAEEIGLTLPYGPDILKRQLLKLLSLDPVEDGMIYFQVNRGTAPRMHLFPNPAVDPQLIGYVIPGQRPYRLQQDGVGCMLTEDIRWLRCDIKSLNLLGNVLAKQKAAESGAYEAILHRGDMVTEGGSTNVFMVRGGKLYTHPANSFILNGITRRTVIELCELLNYGLFEQTFSIEALLQADEVFITGTLVDVLPVTSINGNPISTGTPGPVTRTIQEQFVKLIEKLPNHDNQR